MDGESLRARMACEVWAGVTASERSTKYKTPAALLLLVDEAMKRSYGMGSPLENGAQRVLLDDTQYSVPRFREWLMLLPPEVRALYVEAVTG